MVRGIILGTLIGKSVDPYLPGPPTGAAEGTPSPGQTPITDYDYNQMVQNFFVQFENDLQYKNPYQQQMALNEVRQAIMYELSYLPYHEQPIMLQNIKYLMSPTLAYSLFPY
jgi:hypothetical protein